MAITKYNGNLNKNEVFRTIFNMIISQYVFSDNIETQSYRSLVNRFREEGTLFGDTKLYYATDILRTKPFVLDSVNQLNLLAIERPKDPECQAIVLDIFRFIEVTLDEYFSKRAFSSASTFADYNGQMLSWLRETKEVYDETTFNTYIGTVTSEGATQQQTVDLSKYVIGENDAADIEESKRRLAAEVIGQKLQDIEVAMRDVSRDWNDYGYTRKYDPSNFEVIWNADWVNYIKGTSLPTIFHKDGLFEIKEENILPAHYFGTVNSSSGTVANANTNFAMEETFVEDATTSTDNGDYWAGQALPVGHAFGASETYTKTPGVMSNNSVICKLVHKGSIPYMSGYQTQKEFINVKNLSTNHYLHFAHNTLQYLYNYPLVTLKAAIS